MQDKQKVTLYLPPELHRQLKVRAAIETQPMSALAERAIGFYLSHADIVAEVEESKQGRTYQVYSCPECHTSVVLRSKELVSLPDRPSLLGEDGIPNLESSCLSDGKPEGEESLVIC